MSRKIIDKQDHISYETGTQFKNKIWVDFKIDGDSVVIKMSNEREICLTSKQALTLGIKLQDLAYQIGY